MESNLKSLFYSYVDRVRSTIQARHAREEAHRSDGLVIRRNKVRELQGFVNGLENDERFNRLVQQTLASYPNNPHFAHAAATQAVGHFFRRSRCYIDIFDNQAIAPEALFQMYEYACQRQERRVTYLVPLEGIYFSESSMNFGKFEIQVFSPRALNELLHNGINEYFYHNAIIKTTRLRCFFICCRTTEDLHDIYSYKEDIFERMRDPIKEPYTDFPKVAEDILTILLLGNLGMSGSEFLDVDHGYWWQLYIPFYIKITDDLFDAPEKAPNISKLTDTIDYELDVCKTEYFKVLIGHFTRLFENVSERRDQWRFFDIAKGCFVKACFSMNMIDELLYYIIALEALLGERKKGVSVQLPKMLALVLGRNQDEREMIKAKFEQLYSFRCDIVHGSQMQDAIYSGHIVQAHEFVRRALIWFLHYLNDAETRLPAHSPLRRISREHLLKKLCLLTHDPAAEIWDVPHGFPQVQEWIQWIK